MESAGTIPGKVVVAINTNMDTRLLTLVSRNATIGDLREIIKAKHMAMFPELGEVTVTTVEAELFKGLYRADDILQIGDLFSAREALLHVELMKSSGPSLPSVMPRLRNNVAERESQLPGQEQQTVQQSTVEVAVKGALTEVHVEGDIRVPRLEQAVSLGDGGHGLQREERRVRNNNKRKVREEVNASSAGNSQAALGKEVISITGTISPSHTHDSNTAAVLAMKKMKLEDQGNLGGVRKNLAADLAGVEGKLLQSSVAQKSSDNSSSSDDSRSRSQSGLQTSSPAKRQFGKLSDKDGMVASKVDSDCVQGQIPSSKKDSESQSIKFAVNEKPGIHRTQTSARENVVKSSKYTLPSTDSSSTDNSESSKSRSQMNQRGMKAHKVGAASYVKNIALGSAQDQDMLPTTSGAQLSGRMHKKHDYQTSMPTPAHDKAIMKSSDAIRSSQISSSADDSSDSGDSKPWKVNSGERQGMDGRQIMPSKSSTSEGNGIDNSERYGNHVGSTVGNGRKSSPSDSGDSDDSMKNGTELLNKIKLNTCNAENIVEMSPELNTELHMNRETSENSDQKSLDQYSPISDPLLSTFQSGSETEESTSDGSEEELPRVSNRQMDLAPDNSGELGRSSRRSMRGSAAVDLKYKYLIDSQDGFDELISLSQHKLNFSSEHTEELQPRSDPHDLIAPVSVVDDSLSIDLVPDTQGGNIGSQDVANSLVGTKSTDNICGENRLLPGTNASRFIVKEEVMHADALRNGEEGKYPKSMSQPSQSTNPEIGDTVSLKQETITTDENMAARILETKEEPSQAKSEDSQQIRAAVQLTRMSMSIDVEAEPPVNSPGVKRKKRRQGVSNGEENLLMNFQESMGGLEQPKQSLKEEANKKLARASLRNTSTGMQLETGRQEPETAQENQLSGVDVTELQKSRQELEEEEYRELMSSGRPQRISTSQNNSSLETPDKSLRRRKGGLKRVKEHTSPENKDQQTLVTITKDTFIDTDCPDLENNASLSLKEGNGKKELNGHVSPQNIPLNGRGRKRKVKDLEGNLRFSAVGDPLVGKGRKSRVANDSVEEVPLESSNPGSGAPSRVKGLGNGDVGVLGDADAFAREENHKVLAKEVFGRTKVRKGRKVGVANDLIEEVPVESSNPGSGVPSRDVDLDAGGAFATEENHKVLEMEEAGRNKVGRGGRGRVANDFLEGVPVESGNQGSGVPIRDVGDLGNHSGLALEEIHEVLEEGSGRKKVRKGSRGRVANDLVEEVPVESGNPGSGLPIRNVGDLGDGSGIALEENHGVLQKESRRNKVHKGRRGRVANDLVEGVPVELGNPGSGVPRRNVEDLGDGTDIALEENYEVLEKEESGRNKVRKGRKGKVANDVVEEVRVENTGSGVIRDAGDLGSGGVIVTGSGGVIVTEKNQEVLAKDSGRSRVRKGRKGTEAVDLVEEVPVEEKLGSAALEEGQTSFPVFPEKSKRKSPKSKKIHTQEIMEGGNGKAQQTMTDDGGDVHGQKILEAEMAFLPGVSTEVNEVRADVHSRDGQQGVITIMEGVGLVPTGREKRKSKKKPQEFISPEKHNMPEGEQELQEPVALKTQQLRTAFESQSGLSEKKPKKRRHQQVKLLEDGNGLQAKVDNGKKTKIGQDDEILQPILENSVKEKSDDGHGVKAKKSRKVVVEKDNNPLLWSDLGQVDDFAVTPGTVPERASRKDTPKAPAKRAANGRWVSPWVPMYTFLCPNHCGRTFTKKHSAYYRHYYKCLETFGAGSKVIKGVWGRDGVTKG